MPIRTCNLPASSSNVGAYHRLVARELVPNHQRPIIPGTSLTLLLVARQCTVWPGCWHRQHLDELAARHLDTEVALAYYLRGDYRVGAASSFRFWDMLVLLAMAAVFGCWHPLVERGTVSVAAETAVVVALRVFSIVLLVMTRPLQEQFEWMYAFRVWLPCTTAICSTFNHVAMVDAQGDTGGEPQSPSSAAVVMPFMSLS